MDDRIPSERTETWKQSELATATLRPGDLMLDDDTSRAPFPARNTFESNSLQFETSHFSSTWQRIVLATLKCL